MSDDRCENCDRVKGRGEGECAVAALGDDVLAAYAEYQSHGLPGGERDDGDRPWTGPAERDAYRAWSATCDRSRAARDACVRPDWKTRAKAAETAIATLRRVLVDEHGMLRSEFDEIVAASCDPHASGMTDAHADSKLGYIGEKGAP